MAAAVAEKLWQKATTAGLPTSSHQAAGDGPPGGAGEGAEGVGASVEEEGAGVEGEGRRGTKARAKEFRVIRLWWPGHSWRARVSGGR